MICLACAEPRQFVPDSRCPVCGRPLSDRTDASLEAFARARLERQLQRWVGEGLLAAEVAARLSGTVAGAGSASGLRSGPLTPALSQGEREGAAEFAVSGSAGEGLEDAVEALALLDAPAPTSRWHTEVWPLLREQVGWFLGVLLVLAGSVMGLREAWSSFEGAARLAITAGAFFAYHAGFIGLGLVVARKAPTAGRVLGGLGVGLLPIVYGALALLLQESVPAGLLLAALVTAGVLATVRPVARAFEGLAWPHLAGALLPSLLAQLALVPLAADDWPRATLPLVGLVAVGLAARAWVRGRAGAGALLGASLYGALALVAVAVLGGEAGAVARDGDVTAAGALLWTCTLLALLTPGLGDARVRERLPRAAPALQVVGLAGLTCAVLTCAAWGLPEALSDRDISRALLVATGVALAGFVRSSAHLRRAVHLAVPTGALACALLVRGALPTEAWLGVGVALASAITVLLTTRIGASVRLALTVWGALLGVLAPALAAAAEAAGTAPGQPLVAAVTSAVLVSASAHLAGAAGRRGWHLYGAVGAVLAGLCALGTGGSPVHTYLVLVVVSAVHGALGLLLEPREPEARLRPFDDASLLLGALAVTVSLLAPLPALPPLPGAGGAWAARLQVGLPLAAGAALLLARAARDRSRAVAFLGALGGVRTAWAVAAPESIAQGALVLAASALAALLLANLQGLSRAEARGRRLFGGLPLPLPATGSPLWADGLAGAGLGTGLLALAWVGRWMLAPDFGTRAQVGAAVVLLVACAAVGFLGRSLRGLGLRGSAGMLAATGTLAALVSAIHRLGRPLPPPEVALRLALVTVGLLLAARLLERVGPALARRLERPGEGPRYAVVAHAGVGLLALVQLAQALFLTGFVPERLLLVVPPLFLLGAAAAVLALARPMQQWELLDVGLSLGVLASAAAGAQRAVLGLALRALQPPNDGWVPLGSAAEQLGGDWRSPGALLLPGQTLAQVWGHALEGVGAAAVLLAALALVLGPLRPRLALPALTRHAWRLDVVAKAAARWSALAAGLVCLAGWWQPRLGTSTLVLLTGAGLVAARWRRRGLALAGAAGFLLVHALAQRASPVPAWPGLVLAGLAALAGGAALLRAHARPGGAEPLRRRATVATCAYGLHGLLYALAVGGATAPLEAGPRLVLSALAALGDGLVQPPGVAAALVLWGAGLLALALGATGGAGRRTAAGAWAAWGLAVTTLASTALTLHFPGLSPVGALAAGPALVLGVLAALATASGAALAPVRPGAAWGTRAGRDGLLLASGALLAAFVAAPVQLEPPLGLVLGLAAVGAAGAVCLWAAWRERTGRHLYGAQLALTGAYAVVRAQLVRDWTGEADALAMLVLAFALVGVAVAARRAGLPPLAEATRRFAALLPLATALLLPSGATPAAALSAAASSVLYAVLAFAERSRLYGSLAAVAGNLALLVATLASGLEGTELFLAPVGLLVLCLGQLFASSLAPPARQAVRVAGGLLLYAPAAVKLTFDVGTGASGAYAVAFAGVCLLGVGAGLLFRVRAYLALGLGFFTLDVVANVVQSGLHDHRVGFLLMSSSGLLLIGGMLVTNLQRERVRAWAACLQGHLSAWD